MKIFVFLFAIALFSTESNFKKQDRKEEITKSLKILNIHDTKEAKKLLA
ncbi:hypothetical protein [Flavicella sp.]